MLRSLFILGLCASLTSCATTSRNAEQNITQASAAFFESRQRADTASFVGHFTDDGAFMVPGVADAVGRNAIQELAQKRFAGGPTEDFKVHRREIRFAKDHAYELGWFTETDRRSGQAYRMEGRHLIVWQRAGGQWRVQRYMYNFSDARPAP